MPWEGGVKEEKEGEEVQYWNKQKYSSQRDQGEIRPRRENLGVFRKPTAVRMEMRKKNGHLRCWRAMRTFCSKLFPTAFLCL